MSLIRIHEKVTLTRDCEAIEIPSGHKTTLPAGTEVTITQSLGDSFTVVTERGYMARIDAEDADALGKEVPQVSAQGAAAQVNKPLEELVWEALRTCYDPEIPVNIVDLGLVYGCEVTPLPEGGHRVAVTMTLTAPGCGMGDVLKADAERKIARLPGVKEVHVELVIDPPWSPERMSEVAKLQLGLL
ncbi:MAG: putative Fe-S cluster assembly protein SufT [Abditibacteriales bacterium]|nr:putative Fe-S cluster assembly protein SufT [Abditibacteriales bacterium]MDW8367934.1 putative Fe-S cluster assembly protein SufT [Abditibacteriales bacterium]